MEDLENELLADLGSDIESEDDVDDMGQDHELPNSSIPSPGLHKKSLIDTLQHLLHSTTQKSIQSIIQRFDVSNTCDIGELSKVYPLIPEIKENLQKYSDEQSNDYVKLLSSLRDGSIGEDQEYNFIILTNELSQLINEEIYQFHSFIKSRYKVVFPELETLVSKAADYASIILMIKQDLNQVNHLTSELKHIISSEQVLLVTMSATQQLKKQSQSQFKLSDEDMDVILKACGIVIELYGIHHEITQFIAKKLSKLAPNVTAIVGEITASQLLASAGSLKQLSSMPACNVPALGKNDTSSQGSNKLAKSKNVRQTGYIFHSELVRYLPIDIMRQAIRIISGKVVLAARIDLAQSDPQGNSGKAFLEDINSKIEKLLSPPENSGVKALPAPIEQKSKKRAGKRFRKMKEKFQMSELRKAQNKMEFGKKEETIMDAFGEDIGLGMSRSNGKLIAPTSKNTTAKLSKSMAERLKSKNESQNIDELVIATSIPQKNHNITSQNDSKISQTSAQSKWVTGMKRKRE